LVCRQPSNLAARLVQLNDSGLASVLVRGADPLPVIRFEEWILDANELGFPGDVIYASCGKERHDLLYRLKLGGCRVIRLRLGLLDMVLLFSPRFGVGVVDNLTGVG